MTGRLAWWLGAVVWLAFTVVMVLWPLTVPAGPGRGRPGRQTAVAASAGPHPPETTPDPFHPSWTPPDGRWMMTDTFHDVAARHPVMIAGGLA